mgnify:FL=1|jgi:hypothetical protein
MGGKGKLLEFGVDYDQLSDEAAKIGQKIKPEIAAEKAKLASINFKPSLEVTMLDTSNFDGEAAQAYAQVTNLSKLKYSTLVSNIKTRSTKLKSSFEDLESKANGIK